MIRRLTILLLTVSYSQPPFLSSDFFDQDIITSTDLTTFLEAVYVGQDFREMYDRRLDDAESFYAFLFNAKFQDSLTFEIQVNSEFSNSTTALSETIKYGTEIGRLPTILQKDIETVCIHKGNGNYVNLQY